VSDTPEQTPEGPAPERTCSHCGSALADGQGWCLECGAAAPGSLRSRVPTRAGAVLLGLTIALMLAAGGAAYAALRTPSKHIIVAAVGGPATGPTGPATTDGATGATGAAAPATGTTTPPPPTVTPPTTGAPTTIPKVTAPAETPPAASITTQAPNVTPPPAVQTTKTTTTSSTHTATGPTPLMLDASATSDYNPNNYSQENFGDPSLAIDGDTTTSWSAQVPSTPNAGGTAGLLVDLNSPQKLATLKLITGTPGTTFAVLGANGSQAPATIASPGWTQLAAPIAVKHNQTFTLTTKGHHYRWLLLWILGVKGSPTASLPATVATVASAASASTASTASSSATLNAGNAAATTTATSTSTTSTTVSSSAANTSPLANVLVNELTIYP